MFCAIGRTILSMRPGTIRFPVLFYPWGATEYALQNLFAFGSSFCEGTAAVGYAAGISFVRLLPAYHLGYAAGNHRVPGFVLPLGSNGTRLTKPVRLWLQFL